MPHHPAPRFLPRSVPRRAAGRCFALAGLLCLIGGGAAAAAEEGDTGTTGEGGRGGGQPGPADLWPVLQAKCVGCHQPAKAEGGYLMTDPAALFAGGGQRAGGGRARRRGRQFPAGPRHARRRRRRGDAAGGGAPHRVGKSPCSAGGSNRGPPTTCPPPGRGSTPPIPPVYTRPPVRCVAGLEPGRGPRWRSRAFTRSSLTDPATGRPHRPAGRAERAGAVGPVLPGWGPPGRRRRAAGADGRGSNCGIFRSIKKRTINPGARRRAGRWPSACR